MTDVVGFVQDAFGPVTPSFADKVRVGESTDPGSDLDRDPTGVCRRVDVVSVREIVTLRRRTSRLTIVNPPLESPTVRAPDPVGQGIVDERGPAKHPDHGGQDARSFTRRTEDDGRDETGKHHLVRRKDLRGGRGLDSDR